MIPGDTLRMLRLQAHLTQQELATRIGYSQSQVHAWERGACLIPRDILPTLLKELTEEIALIAEWNAMFARLRVPAPHGPKYPTGS